MQKNTPYTLNQNFFDRRDQQLTNYLFPMKDMDWYYQYTLHTGGPHAFNCPQTNTNIDGVKTDEVTPK